MAAPGTLDLRDYIRDIPDYPKAGIVFRDVTPLFLDAEALEHTVALLALWASERDVDFVVAAEARGFVLGGAIAARIGAGFLPAPHPDNHPREGATPETWTTVMLSARGRAIRADHTRTASEEPERLEWRQELDESPFERVFSEIVTEISLEPEGDDATRVKLKTVRKLRGRSRFGGIVARRAARRQLDAALDGLGEALGEPSW